MRTKLFFYPKSYWLVCRMRSSSRRAWSYDAAVLLHAKDELWSKGKNTNIDGAGAFDAFAQGDREDVDDAIEAAVQASGVDGEITHIEAEMLAGLFDAADDV